MKYEDFQQLWWQFVERRNAGRLQLKATKSLSLFINHNLLPWKPSAIRFQADPSIIKTNSKELWNKIYWCLSELELEWLSRAFHAADCVPLLAAAESARGKKGRLCWRREGAPSLLNESQVVVWRKVAGRSGWGRVGLVNSSRVEKRLSKWPETVGWLSQQTVEVARSPSHHGAGVSGGLHPCISGCVDGANSKHLEKAFILGRVRRDRGVSRVWRRELMAGGCSGGASLNWGEGHWVVCTLSWFSLQG